jgi:hypothetical protein
MSEKDKIKNISDESIEKKSLENDSIIDPLEKTEEDREFYRLHSEPHQMEIDQRILGRMAPLSFMGGSEKREEEQAKQDIKNIFAPDGILYTSTEEDMD